MNVVILSGGLGTRLYPETEHRPKSLVPIGGRPILWYTLQHFLRFGFREFVLCLGYRGDLIKDYMANYRQRNDDFTIQLSKQDTITYHGQDACDFRATLVETGAESSTGERLKRAQRYIESDQFIVTYGDVVSNVDLRRLVRFHATHGHIATVTTIQPISHMGIMTIDRDWRVHTFAEKPRLDVWASIGYFVFDHRLFQRLGAVPPALEQGILGQLAADGELMAFPHAGFFEAMDTHADYLRLNRLWELGELSWLIAPVVDGTPQ